MFSLMKAMLAARLMWVDICSVSREECQVTENNCNVWDTTHSESSQTTSHYWRQSNVHSTDPFWGL